MLVHDTPIVMDDLALVELPCCHRGRILLAGDAAHSLSLISSDRARAWHWLGLRARAGIGQAATEQALAAYERRLRPVIDSLRQRSRKLAPVYVPASACFGLRNTALRLLPRLIMKRHFLSGLKSEMKRLPRLADRCQPASQRSSHSTSMPTTMTSTRCGRAGTPG